MSLGQSPIFHGAKAKVFVDNKLIGVFTSVQYSKAYGLHVAHILGRHSPAAMTYTHQEAISISMTGFRVIDAGPYRLGLVPELENLMKHPGVNIQVEDRTNPQNPKIVVRGVLYGTNFSTGVNARSISDVTVTGLMPMMDDETSDDAEYPGATKIDDGI
jgi:hypothetical protein